MLKFSQRKINIETPLRFTKFENKKSDTLQVFIPNDAKDSLNILVKSDNYSKEYSVKLKKLKEADSLKSFSFSE